MTWRTLDGAVVPMLALILTVAAVGLVTAAPAARASATPTGYLLSAQNPDGGLGVDPGGSSSELYSGWAALGLAADGRNPLDVSAGGTSLLAYIRDGGGSFSDIGALERTILVVRAAGLPSAASPGATWSPRCSRPSAATGPSRTRST